MWPPRADVVDEAAPVTRTPQFTVDGARTTSWSGTVTELDHLLDR